MKNPLIIGNWKLNGNKNIINNKIPLICNKLNNNLNCEVVIAPPIIYCELVKKYLKKKSIFLGAQNVDIHDFGAFTGEISAKMLVDLGIKYVIIGHSERRIYHNENSDIITKKFYVSKEAGLIPVLCIGENEEEKKQKKTKIVCEHQINEIINNLGIKAFENSVIAYEPIWAINNNNAASPEEVQIIHKIIRNNIAKKDEFIAKNIRIQYGGSVNDKNVYQLLIQPDVDGVLVGKSSLEVNNFVKIINIASQIKK